MLQAHCGSLLLDPAVLAQVHKLAQANNTQISCRSLRISLQVLMMNAVGTKCTRTKPWTLFTAAVMHAEPL